VSELARQTTRFQVDRETFYDRVYEFVRCVPRGTVVTYGQVALELGAPSAARAVGYALHYLPGTSDAEGVRFTLEGKIRLREFRWIGLGEP
jgi:alkylated DNA nucleotide flippase Atl1